MTLSVNSHEFGVTPATPATPASQDEHPAVRATPATPATPAVPPTQEDEVVNTQEEVVKVSKRRNGLRRAEQSDHVNFGQITSEQWALVHDFKKGELTEEELRTQFLALYKSKLDILVEEEKISVEEENRRIARFTTILDKIITNFS